MKSSGNLNLVPKHIMTSLKESPRLIVDFHIHFILWIMAQFLEILSLYEA